MASRNSEFSSYVYIRNDLEKLNWNIKNPERDPQGQLYTQQECLDNILIGPYLGRQKPEYVVKVEEDVFWVIEAKAMHAQLEQAFSEAVEYAQCINKNPMCRAFIVSGVAGNEVDKYLIKTAVIFGNGEIKSVMYNDKEITSLLSVEQAKYLVENRTNQLNELIEEENILLDIAEEINEELHKASINKDQRSSVMASVLLSMISDTLPNFDASPEVFIKDINNRAEDVLIEHSKREYAEQIELKLPQENSAKAKYKAPIVKVFFLLRKINVKAAMNSSNDVLGKFYEVFLKYGNGAKDIGIVLTPRHITNFACQILDINASDIIFDPACGTGGFLVAAYDKVKLEYPEHIQYFKKHKIFGIEQQASVAVLAIVNMIFRGDGKNNIINENCFAINLQRHERNGDLSAKYIHEKNSRPPVTKTLMNPPFALKKGDEQEHVFIDYALNQMQNNGLLFAVLPVSVMYSGADFNWRKNLLKNNMLVSVISFPQELFYPQASVESIGVIIKKGIPHPIEKEILWLKITNDGFKKHKKRRVHNNAKSELDIYSSKIKEYIINDIIPKQEVGICQNIAIKKDDIKLELIPQNYLGTEKVDFYLVNEQMKKEYFEMLLQQMRKDL